MALTARALCSLADLKTELGISGSSEDTRLERLIEAATQVIERYCGRSYGFHYEAARIEDQKGMGTVLMHLRKTPAWSIGSIVWDPTDANQTITATLYSLDDKETARVYREDGWDWTAAFAEYFVQTPLPGTEQRLYRVTYACGYQTPGQTPVAGVDALPVVLTEACLQLTSMRYRWAARDPGVTSERLLSWGASYDASKGAGGFDPSAVAGLIDSFRRVEFA